MKQGKDYMDIRNSSNKQVAHNNSRKDAILAVTSVFGHRSSLPTGQTGILFENVFSASGKNAHNYKSIFYSI